MEFQNKKEVFKTNFQNKTKKEEVYFIYFKQKREFKHKETTYILFIKNSIKIKF